MQTSSKQGLEQASVSAGSGHEDSGKNGDQRHAETVDNRIIPKRPIYRWDDPLCLIESTAPSDTSRLVLWIVCILMSLLLVWAAFDKMDIVASAEGKLVPQTLVKIVQPAESGVVQQLTGQ